MPGTIGKAVGQQFGEIGKQVGKDLLSIPKGLVGMDSGTNEAKSQSGGSGKTQTQITQTKTPSENVDPLEALRQKDEMQKQKMLEEIRNRLKQIMTPKTQGESVKTPYEQKQLEELEKQKLEIQKMKEEAKRLKLPISKRPRGDLYGIKAKRFAGEQGKNVVAQ